MTAFLLETPRLILRRFADADLPLLCERIFSDPAVMRHAFSARTMDAAEAEDFLRGYSAGPDQDHGMGVLIERVSGEILGLAGLVPCKALGADDVELGFLLASLAQGKGYAQEIGRAQIACAFTALDRPRVLALASPDNQASLKALDRLGMQPFGEVQSDGRGTRLVRVAWRDARPQA